MPAGRPTDYRPEYCDIVVELGKHGVSKEEMALELGISVTTFYTWQAANEEFLKAVKQAEGESIGWWKKEGRTNLKDKDFSATLWYMNMKNRFGWKDKTETEHSGSVEIKNIKDMSNEELIAAAGQA